jgi:hypothetical protein
LADDLGAVFRQRVDAAHSLLCFLYFDGVQRSPRHC